MTVRVYSDQAGTTAAAANDNIGKVEDLSKFDSDGVSSTTGPYLSVDANGFGSADILAQGGDVTQTFTNAIADGSALVVGTSKCIFFSNVNVEAGGTLTIGPAGDMINTNGLNLIGKVVSVATTTKVLTTAEQNSIATFFADRGASSVVVNDETVYDVNSVEADVVLDFTGDSFYRNVPHYFKLGGTYTTFADAFTGTSPKLTYSTTSNSTMTQGYGPELVTNGGFDTDSGWTTNSQGSGHSITGGQLVMSSSPDLSTTIRDIDIIGGGAYSVTVDVASVSSGALRLLAYGPGANEVVITPNISTAGVHVFDLPADDTGSAYLGKVVVQARAANTSAVINSVSVREAPKIVWAPHNLVSYSDDLTGVATAYSSLTIDSADTFTFTTNTSYIRLGQITGAATKGKYTARAYISGDTPGDTFNIEIVDDADGSDSNTSNVTVSATPQWVEVTADFSGSSTFSGTLALYINRSTSNRSITAGSTVTIKHIHLYRSDLGGMAQVPGADTGFETYVPTNGSAEYLPRVGHHVYNGSTWVNEGLLIESEARTNLVTTSAAISGGNWNSSTGGVITENAVTAPDGTQTGSTYDTNGAYRILRNVVSVAAGTTYTWSFYAKNIDATSVAYRVYDETQAADIVSATSYFSQINTSDWTRVSVSFTAPAGCSQAAVYLTSGNNGGTVAFWGAQLEAGSTPSSYMPTSGGTYTRTAQSLTVPPAEFGWPEPEYIGQELADGSQLDKRSGTDGTVSRTDGIISWTPAATGLSTAVSEEITGLTVGKVYEFRGRARSLTSDGFTLQLRSGSGGGGSSLASSSTSFTTSFADVSIIYKATATSVHLSYVPSNRQDIEIVEASHSFREINPLSVSVQMDGRMTYADDVTDGELVRPYRWHIDNNNRIQSRLSVVSGSDTGNWLFQQTDAAANDEVATGSNTYTPGILTPFNIASRHGSTFINGAVDGVALTADTTPTALPDLSGTDLQIAYDFMGTIGTFRQFAGDIGDAGLVTATNPSTEPTLSLNFGATATGSFYNLSWSE